MESLVRYAEKQFAYFGIIATTLAILGASWKAYKAWKVFIVPLFRYRDPRRFGQWAVVTGAADGLGKSYACQLARRGMDIILMDRNPQQLLGIAEMLDHDYNVRVDIIQVDFTNGWDIYPEIKEVLRCREIGILVNGVSIKSNTPCCFLDDTSEEVLDKIVVNIESMLIMTTAVLRQMIARNRGAIVNVCSMSCTSPCPYDALYSATKTFVHRFTRGLQREYHHTDIVIQSIMPCSLLSESYVVRRYLNNIRFLVPDADIYCDKSLSTLGVSDYTTGYWSHSLYYILKMVLPISAIYNLSVRFRKTTTKKKSLKERRIISRKNR